MKLSEAIRLGSMLHPQAFDGLKFYRGADGSVSRYGWKPLPVVMTCALGAADEAGYPHIFESQDNEFYATCPICAMHHYLANVISHLNDDHRWTREAIACWVATVEPADEPHAPPPATNAVDPVPQLVAEGLRA